MRGTLLWRRLGCILAPVLALFVLVLSGWAGQAGDAFPPMRTEQGDAGFSAFLQRLEAVVARRDAQAMLELVDEECVVSHGGFRGRKGFRQYWFGAAAPGGDLFAGLAQALKLGGMFAGTDQDLFALPYTALAPAEDETGSLLGVVLGSGVNLHTSPGLNTPVSAVLDQELVRYCANRFVPYSVDGQEWVCLLGPDGLPGFVVREFVRSPLEQAFVFRRTAAGWRLTSCVAGAGLETPTGQAGSAQEE